MENELPLTLARLSSCLIGANPIYHSRHIMIGYRTVLSDPVKVFEKKLHHSNGRWSFFKTGLEQVLAIAISQWLKNSYLREVESHCSQFLSQRSGWIVFQISATRTIAQWELNFNKTLSKTQCKKGQGLATDSRREAGRLES